jgi:hypothetical protein
MRIPSWLRRAVADFFCVGPDEDEAAAEAARQELEELRSLTTLAVAQARRTELELKDVLSRPEPDEQRLVELVPRLEEERARANNLMERYRQREAREEERLSRVGQVRLAEELNQRRRELRETVNTTSAAARESELVEMEDEARAEAFRLDVADTLDAGEHLERDARSGEDRSNLAARARELLEQPAIEPASDE